MEAKSPEMVYRRFKYVLDGTGADRQHIHGSNFPCY
jgi:hypothetical protein